MSVTSNDFGDSAIKESQKPARGASGTSLSPPTINKLDVAYSALPLATTSANINCNNSAALANSQHRPVNKNHPQAKGINVGNCMEGGHGVWYVIFEYCRDFIA